MDQAALTTLHAVPALVQSAWIIRRRRILGIVTAFLLGQGTSQALTLLAGLFLVRHLSTQLYAQFGLTSGFQTMFLTLMDLGFAGTIVPLVGHQTNDRALLGRHVRAAKHLRDRAFLAIAPIAAFSFLGLMHRQHWTWNVQGLLLFSVLLTLYSGERRPISPPRFSCMASSVPTICFRCCRPPFDLVVMSSWHSLED